MRMKVIEPDGTEGYREIDYRPVIGHRLNTTTGRVDPVYDPPVPVTNEGEMVVRFIDGSPPRIIKGAQDD